MPVGLSFDQVEFAALRSRLREAGEKGLVRELNVALKASAFEIQHAEQSAALSLPATGAVVTGLRESIAAATAIRISDSAVNPGVRVYVQNSKVRGKLGRDTNRAGWRHPVFGHKNTWVTQTMSPGWWFRTAAPFLPAARRRAKLAVETTVAKIAGR